MSDMHTYGSPVDALDRGCKNYKDCQRCTREHFGEMCAGEFVEYRFRVENGEIVSSLVNLCSYTFFSSVSTRQTHVHVPYASVI